MIVLRQIATGRGGLLPKRSASQATSLLPVTHQLLGACGKSQSRRGRLHKSSSSSSRSIAFRRASRPSRADLGSACCASVAIQSELSFGGSAWRHVSAPVVGYCQSAISARNQAVRHQVQPSRPASLRHVVATSHHPPVFVQVPASALLVQPFQLFALRVSQFHSILRKVPPNPSLNATGLNVRPCSIASAGRRVS